MYAHLRIYTVNKGMMDAWLNLFKEKLIPLLTEVGIGFCVKLDWFPMIITGIPRAIDSTQLVDPVPITRLTLCKFCIKSPSTNKKLIGILLICFFKDCGFDVGCVFI